MPGESLPLLVLAGAPDARVRMFRELLHYACDWAKDLPRDDEKDDADEIFEAIWTRLITREVPVHPDHRGPEGASEWLQYYGTSEDPPAGGDFASAIERIKTRDGTCGAWARFMRDLCRSHGVNVSALGIYPVGELDGFVVQRAQLGNPHQEELAELAQALGHPNAIYLGSEVNLNLTGLAGQGVETPQRKRFFDHAVIVYENRIYDPSYGTPYGSLAEWEKQAVVAFALFLELPDGTIVTLLEPNDATAQSYLGEEISQ